MSEEPGDAAAPRSERLAIVGILAALVAIGVVGCWQFSVDTLHDARERYDRGIECAEKGDLDRAIPDLTKAIELKPDYADAYYNRGIAYREKGELDRARQDWGKAVELDPEGGAGAVARSALKRLEENGGD